MSTQNLNYSNLDARYVVPTALPWSLVLGLTGGASAAAANATLIQNAINAASTAGGGVVVIPTGTWYSNPLAIKSRVTLRGQGWGTILMLANGANTHFITLNDAQTEQTLIDSIRLDGNKSNQTAASNVIHYDNTGFTSSFSGLSLGDPNHSLDRVLIYNAYQHGVYIAGSLGQGQFKSVYSYYSNGNAFKIAAPDTQFISCVAAESGLDGYFIGGNNTRIINSKSWLSGNVDSTNGSGFNVNVASRVDLIGCEAQDNRQHGFAINASTHVNLIGSADRNGIGPEPAHAGGNGSGLIIGNSSKIVLNIVCGDRNTGTIMQHWGYQTYGTVGEVTGTVVVGNTSSGVANNGTFGWQSNVKVTYNGALQPINDQTPILTNVQTGNYTLSGSDGGACIEFNAASAVTLTIPPNSNMGFPVGTIIEVAQVGAGQVTITPGPGVTIDSRGSVYKTAGQYAAATLRKRATDEWIIAGDLA